MEIVHLWEKTQSPVIFADNCCSPLVFTREDLHEMKAKVDEILNQT